MTHAREPSASLARIFDELGARAAAGEDVCLGDVLRLTGSRAHGVAILLLALPEALPLPIPSFGAVLGVPLLIVATHLAIFGEDVRLPPRALQREIPSRMLDALARYGAPILRRAERMSAARLAVLAERERLIGLLAVAMSLMLFLPIPLLNVPPALVLVFLAWGLVQRDGLFVLLGLVALGGLIAGIGLTGEWLLRLISR